MAAPVSRFSRYPIGASTHKFLHVEGLFPRKCGWERGEVWTSNPQRWKYINFSLHYLRIGLVLWCILPYVVMFRVVMQSCIGYTFRWECRCSILHEISGMFVVDERCSATIFHIWAGALFMCGCAISLPWLSFCACISCSFLLPFVPSEIPYSIDLCPSLLAACQFLLSSKRICLNKRLLAKLNHVADNKKIINRDGLCGLRFWKGFASDD